MKTTIFISGILVILAYFGLDEAIGQWSFNGTDIYNTNSGNVGIGSSTPGSLLYVIKNTTEPTITIRNLGGVGGATYSMIDDASGAEWKFKATLNGGFKIRDHANGLDVIVIEPGCFADAIYIKNTGNIGIGTASPDNSALVDMTSTTKGFLPPRLAQSQIESFTTPPGGMVVFCTTDDKYYAFIASAGVWKELSFVTPFPCGNPITINHVAGSVAPVTKTVTYGTVSNIPGDPEKCWIASNLGADQQATVVNDATEASAGWYWQFNRAQGYKHDGVTRTPNTTWDTGIGESSDWSASNDPCNLEFGNNWRLPTMVEWLMIDSYNGWGNWNGPFDSPLKLHAAGYLDDPTGSLLQRGYYGRFWSSTQMMSADGWALNFRDYFSGAYCGVDYFGKSFGFTVRCIHNM